MDRTHNPEFTVMEIYVTYKDYLWMMDFTEEMVEQVALAVNGTTELEIWGQQVSFRRPFRRITMTDAIREKTGFDITGKSEEELREAKERAEESNKLKSAFLANMSHEIRTPLNAIVGFSELLANENRDETRREYTDIILRNNTLLLQIISDVLDLARIESGRMDIERTQFDARDLCREIADSLRLQRRPGVELRVEEGLPELFITEYRQGLAQVLNNFTRNALKFTGKGSVTIGFRRIPGHIRFYVRDTGIGIAPEDRERIFERFVKLDTFTQGTGLGLSICKSIAEQLGGSVGVDSVTGEGSCFRIDIPSGE